MAEKEINKNGFEVLTGKDYRSQRTDITMLTHKEATGIEPNHFYLETNGIIISQV